VSNPARTLAGRHIPDDLLRTSPEAIRLRQATRQFLDAWLNLVAMGGNGLADTFRGGLVLAANPFAKNIVVASLVADPPQSFQTPAQPTTRLRFDHVSTEPQRRLGATAGDAEFVQRLLRKTSLRRVRQALGGLLQGRSDRDASAQPGTSS
jgi:hypothetical protein